MSERRTRDSSTSTLLGGVPPEAIRTQLARILGHRDFEATERTRAFLRFVVEETLAGRANRLKGFTIALEVFGRPQDFDANLDPIVRIQAGRLRRALEHYYLVAGGNDPVRIDVPKGRYVPTFTRQEAVEPAPIDSTAESIALPGPTIAILPLDDLSGGDVQGYFLNGLVEELSAELNRYEDVVPIPCRDVVWAGESGSRPHDLGRELGARFVVGGSVRRDASTLKVSAHLTEAATGQQLWSDSYRIALEAASLIETQEAIARSIIAAVAGEYGAVATRLSRESRGKPPAALSTYEALLRYHHYMLVMTPEAGQDAFVALRQATEREPEYGPAWSAFANLHAHAYVFERPGVDRPLEQAMTHAQRGVALEPSSQLARTIMAYVYLLSDELALFHAEADVALALNPHSPNFAGTIGYLLVTAGAFERGAALLQQAMAQNPCHPKWFHHALYAVHFVRGEYDEAYNEAMKVAVDMGFWAPAVRAAVLGELGRLEDAAACTTELLRLVPDFEERAHAIVRRTIKWEPLAEAFVDGLKKAGLQIDG